MASRSRPAPMTPGDTGSANVSGFEPAESLSGCKCTAGKTNETTEKEDHMNILQKVILRVCWQEEQYDRHASRPWLRWLMRRTETSRGRSSGRRLSKETNHVSQSEFFATSNDHVVPALTLLDEDIGDGLWMVTLNDFGPGARDGLSVQCFNSKQAAETFIAAQQRARS
jgi:hypothetical protein